MYCRTLTRPDIDKLVPLIPLFAPDPRVEPWTHGLLDWYCEAGRAVQHGSFSRVIEFGQGLFGHVSANLIPNRRGDVLEERGLKELIYDPDVREPLTESELRKANRGEGSTLFVTSFFWNRDWNPARDAAFSRVAINHLVSWFEGNTVSSVVFTVENRFRKLVSGVVRQISTDQVRIVRLDETLSLVRLKAPWKPPYTLSAVNWAEKVLAEPRQCGKSISDDLKLKGRVYREFGFDDVRAIDSGCLGAVGKVAGVAPGNSATFRKWKTEVASRLGLKPEGSRQQKRVDADIARLLNRYPSLLAL